MYAIMKFSSFCSVLVGVRYNGVCHEEGIPFNTTDGCNTCTCTSSSMDCEPVPGACLEGYSPMP